jgi:hypothetical protein
MLKLLNWFIDQGLLGPASEGRIWIWNGHEDDQQIRPLGL